MNDTRKGKFYALMFLFFLIFLIVGGYFLTKSLTKKEEATGNEETPKFEKVDPDKLKIDKEEDFIYFVNKEVYSEELDIVYQDIMMNINSVEAREIANVLNRENATLEESIKLISDQKLSESENEKIVYRIKDIYEAKYREYTRYFSDKYASLVINDYEFDCFTGSKYLRSKAYVIDTVTGKVLTNEEILKKSNLTMEEIKLKVQEKLVDEEDIDITSTLTGLDDTENFALYINKSGQIAISYIVKTTNSGYNDTIVLN